MPPVRLERDGDVAELILDAPPLNLFGEEVLDGLELSLACDVLWAGTGVQFGLVEKVVGITPLMGGTQRIAERAGSGRARELVMTGNRYTAETLLDWGVVNRVVAGDGREVTPLRRAARRWADGPGKAHFTGE